MTIAGIEQIFIEQLQDRYDKTEASGITWLCISYVCKLSRIQYLDEKSRELTGNEPAEFHRILAALKSGIPVQYVLGETEFYGSTFSVNPDVLIPRPETEELTDWILKDLRSLSLPGTLKILDIGTGSACIPVSIKKFFPEAELSAMDISVKALSVARRNAAMNHTDIEFIQDDILNPARHYSGFSIIVSNPPYVTLKEKEQMHSNVLEHEPHTALFVPDNDPLVFYKAITDFALRHLEGPAYLYLEINENYGKEIWELLDKKGFKNIELKKDLRDKDRMVKAELNIRSLISI